MSDINFSPSRNPLENPFGMILLKGSTPGPPQKLVGMLKLKLNTFEGNLLRRIKNLKPVHIEDVFSLSWMKEAMESLSKTHTDVKCLITTLVLPVCDSDWDGKWIHLYFNNSVKLLNICTAFKNELGWLSYARLAAQHALFDPEYTPSYPGRSKLDLWMTYINRKKPKIEECLGIIENLITEALDLSKIKKSAKEEKVIMTAMFGATIQTVFVCNIIAAVLSRSCAKNIIDFEVPKTCLWAAAFYDVQSFVNVEIRKLYYDGRIMGVKEMEEVTPIMEKFCLILKDGVHSIDAARAFKKIFPALKKNTENYSVGLDHLKEEVNGLVDGLQSGRNVLLALLSFREKYPDLVAEQKTPKPGGQSLASCIEASRPEEPKMILPKDSCPGLSQKLVAMLNTFEDNLLQRIKNLKPVHIEDVLSLSWMKAAMESLSKTHYNVKHLITTLVLPVCDCNWDSKWINWYLDISVKFLNICTAFKTELVWLNYSKLVAEKALLHPEYTPSNKLPSKSLFELWMTYINRKNPKIEDCLGIVDNLITEALDLSKIKNYAKEEKVIMIAVFGATVQTAFVCRIIAAALSRSCAKKIIDLEVPGTCSWAAAFYDVQSFVNVGIQKLYANGRIMEVKEIEGVTKSMEMLYLILKDGVDSVDAAKALKKSLMNLKKSSENYSVGLDHLGEEVNNLVEVLQSGHNALLSFREKYSETVSEQTNEPVECIGPEPVVAPEPFGQSWPSCIETSCPHEPKRPFFPFRNTFKLMLPKGLSPGLPPKLAAMLNTLEEKLLQRIKKLKPVHVEDVLSLSWMKAAMESLSSTHTDVKCFIKAMVFPACDYGRDSNWISVYFVNSVKFHNICTAFINELRRLNYCKLLARNALLDLNSTPSKQLQASGLLQLWITYVSWKNPKVEECFVILNSLINEALDLSKIIRKSAKEEKVILLAMFGAIAQTICVCSVIASALSGSSCAKMIIDVKVPKTCLWAAAFYDVQSFINKEFRNLYKNNKIIEVKEVEEVNRDAEKLYLMIQDGVGPVGGAEALANKCSELRKSIENLSVGLDHLEAEVDGLFKILKAGDNAFFGEHIYTNKVADKEQHRNDKRQALKSGLHGGGRMKMGLWELIKSSITQTEHEHTQPHLG